MASELRVNTLKDAAGNNSIATSFVAGGSAKAWVNFNGTGTIAIRDSLNAAGLVDDGTGIYTVNYSNSLSDANNSPVTGAGGSGYTDRLLTLDTVSASSVKVVEDSGGNTQDVLICTIHSMGDLA